MEVIGSIIYVNNSLKVIIIIFTLIDNLLYKFKLTK
jgi:hypothetical protein